MDERSWRDFKITSIAEAIAAARYNSTGIAMTELGCYEIGDQRVDILLVSMRPLVGVPLHLHRCGGESQLALTPIRGVFGRPPRGRDGQYQYTEAGRVRFEVQLNRILTPNEVVSIPAGFVHGYGNPSETQDAHVIFNLPHTHTTAADRLLADCEMQLLKQTPPIEDYEQYAAQLSR